eukprot:CAMPEP_0170563520 /NCGR_PEP_ID=MMETSP0211-20121228/67188_1 /TAXON_ID=311385 /ORGANISM="Pseudokeronopsis sp., Strain OXSARD2" /LENGTH=30 /DNA_ID= /DNA_START= /DNA_END= /DNA_ORIENTATION=
MEGLCGEDIGGEALNVAAEPEEKDHLLHEV